MALRGLMHQAPATSHNLYDRALVSGNRVNPDGSYESEPESGSCFSPPPPGGG